jgi:uncharacterized repeat protein (TIGR03803 family)
MRKLRLGVAMLVCAIATLANAQTPTVLYNFGSHSGDPINPELAYWTQGRDGNLYSTAPTGGANGDGAAFYYSFSTGLVTVLHSFIGTDGSAPTSGLTLGTDGNFYGTTSAGGANGAGTVFQINGATLAFKTLYDFTNGSDGGTPYAPPVQGTNGLLYGTTSTGGGAAGCGTVYSISTSGAPPTTLHQFAGSSGSDGCTPIAPLALGNDGNFYGTTNVGGTSVYQAGTVFKISPSGTPQVLHNFDDTDGYEPNGLILGNDGYFYGTTAAGGTTGYGVVFRITPAGGFIVLHNFKGGKSDGAQAYTGLVQANNGELYGVTTGGGTNSNGTIFGFSPKPFRYSLVYSFVQSVTGDIPEAPLIQRTDGLLYGDTFRGGSPNGEGTFFSLNLGLQPLVILVPASGKVGKTIGILGQGFTAATVVSFNGTAASAVHVASATYLTATVPAGATTGSVAVTTSATTLTSNHQFRVTPQIKGFTPPSGPVGTMVTITGVSLTQATRITFGGVAATFTVNSDTQVTATVPTGAVTGKIKITTAGGTAVSAASFTVTP